MKRSVLLGLFAAGLLLSTTSRADLIRPGQGQPPKQRLRSLFIEFWDDELKADPINATYVGDHRHNDRLPDPSETAINERAKRWKDQLERLRQIPAEELSADERIDRDVLIFTFEDRLAGLPYRGFLIPFTQQEGLHLSFAQSVNFFPTSTVGDFANYIKRLNDFPTAVDATLAVLKQGMAEHRVPPKVTLAKVIPQLRALAPTDPKQSPLYGIVARIPKNWPEAEQKRIASEVETAIATRVSPAFHHWADYLEQTYLPACRDSVGIWDSPDGPAYYDYLVRSFTTTNLTADQVHEIGLAEIAKTRAGMDEVRKKVGFQGDLDAFLTFLRTDKQFRNTTPEAILAKYREILSNVDAQLPKLFGTLPKTDYDLRAIEAYRAKSAPAGYYYPFPTNGSRPGYFYVNTSDPKQRTTFSMQALAYHEAVPGHHLQFALTVELSDRPEFRRNGYVPAFSEGWALYSETLPRDVGLYTDPYAEYGRLEYSGWRAARLVVDTGLHAKKWTRQQAIDYLEKNSAMPRVEVESEVDRYIAWPGQALAYKIGELKIREIRSKWEKAEGARFDIRAFHDRLLSQGSLPLTVLERWMDLNERKTGK